MTSPVSYTVEGRLGIVTIDNPPVNALSHAVRAGLLHAIENAQTDSTEALLLVCAGRTFVAGADITEFGKPPKAPHLPDLLNTIENSVKPVVAAIHGTALGGGFELALAAHYRCGLHSAKLGLPEVRLGLLPGAGGTQRLPRLVGIPTAIEMMTSGGPVDADAAAAAGVLDALFEDDLLANARVFCADIAANGPRKTSERPVEPVDPDTIAAIRAQVEKRARGQIAPVRIVDVVAAAAEHSFTEGLDIERDAFLELMQSEQSAALRHVFFAEREAAKILDLPRDTEIRKIQTVGIIGAGTMGGGIGMSFANAGFDVTLVDINKDSLGRGLTTIEKNYAISVKKGKLSEADAKTRRERIVGTTDFAELANMDLVIEAVFENLQLKQDIFKKLDATCKPGAILATNTSYQDVDAIAAVTRRPAAVIGLHFFSPANIMKLLEVVRAEKTADDVLATCMALAKTIRKVPVMSGVCYGFIGNRMLSGYGREAQLCVLEGSSPESVDAALENFGMAMGPLAVFDLAGLDVGYKARESLPAEARGDETAYRVADVLVEAGRLGQKTGAGFYRYDAQTRQRLSDPDVMAIVEREAASLGIERRDISAEEIVQRTTYALINEGLDILHEGIAQRPGDIDIVYLYGYGFPAYRGGPMYYADAVGLPAVLAAIQGFAARFGAENWTPSPLLERLVAEGISLREWAASK